MLQHDEPGDFVVATGEAHTVREFCQEAFGCARLNWQDYVEVDPAYLRPTEVDYLMGDYSKAKATFGWYPKTSFQDLVRLMVDSDERLAEEEHFLRELSGRSILAAARVGA